MLRRLAAFLASRLLYVGALLLSWNGLGPLGDPELSSVLAPSFGSP